MLDSYRISLRSANRAKCYFALLLLSLVFLPAIGSAESYTVENSEGTFKVQILSTHVEVTDQGGNVMIISTEGDGIVNLEKFGASGGYTVTSSDTSGITVSQEEQDAYDELMAGTTVSSSGDDSGGGGGGISPNPIIRGSMAAESSITGDASIQSWGCVWASVQLAAAGASVYGSCSNPVLGWYCAAALTGYVGAAQNFSSSCG